jgi:hypothetical protein
LLDHPFVTSTLSSAPRRTRPPRPRSRARWPRAAGLRGSRSPCPHEPEEPPSTVRPCYNQPMKMKTCSECGEQVERRILGPHVSGHRKHENARYEWSLDGGTPYVWKICPACGEHKRIIARCTYCSRRCAGSVRRGPMNATWKGDLVKHRAARNRAHARYPLPATCSQCGADGPIDRHHVDGNTRNNEQVNIAFLCKPCHGRTRRKHPRPPCVICGTECKRWYRLYCSHSCRSKAGHRMRAARREGKEKTA